MVEYLALNLGTEQCPNLGPIVVRQRLQHKRQLGWIEPIQLLANGRLIPPFQGIDNELHDIFVKIG